MSAVTFLGVLGHTRSQNGSLAGISKRKVGSPQIRLQLGQKHTSQTTCVFRHIGQ